MGLRSWQISSNFPNGGASTREAADVRMSHEMLAKGPMVWTDSSFVTCHWRPYLRTASSMRVSSCDDHMSPFLVDCEASGKAHDQRINCTRAHS
eukprot:3688880-Pleurochrysis_carterae.AAC.1